MFQTEKAGLFQTKTVCVPNITTPDYPLSSPHGFVSCGCRRARGKKKTDIPSGDPFVLSLYNSPRQATGANLLLRSGRAGGRRRSVRCTLRRRRRKWRRKRAERLSFSSIFVRLD